MKTTKQRLQELAGVTPQRKKINEAFSAAGPIKLEVTVTVEQLINMFGGAEMLDPSVMADPNKFNEFARTVAEDLEEWIAQGDDSRTWAADGVDAGTYDDFVASGDY